MSRRVKPPRPAEPPSEPHLSSAERSELQRQGAKAAARGERAGTNPLTLPHNKPPATGESADKWSLRSDAWEQGHEAQSVARRKKKAASPQGGTGDHD